MDNDERLDERLFDEDVTEPNLPAVTPSADATASLGRTVRVNDQWTPPLDGWSAPHDPLGDTEPMLAAPLVAGEASRWTPSPELMNRPTRRMRRLGMPNTERSLFAAMGALTAAALVCAVAAIAIAFVATHANVAANSAPRQNSGNPGVTIQATATATRAPSTPTPTAVSKAAAAQPLPVTQPTATTAPTPTVAPTVTPTAQPTATTPAPTPTTAPTATPAPAPTSTPAPAPTSTSAPVSTPTAPAPTPTP